MRHVAWFSGGAASAVAAWLTVRSNPETLIVRCVVPNEHPDNDRFARDCEFLFGKGIIELKAEEYADCWDVWEKTRWLNGPRGARCTVEMKKVPRQKFQKLDDIQVFGFTADKKDAKRAENFPVNNPEVSAKFPLVERGITKNKCFEIIQSFGIELPMMYRLGYKNANCIGCVKGGAGYWNKIRKDFPAVFDRMAALERSIGATCLRKGKTRLFLDKLDPTAGRNETLDLPECGLACGMNGGSVT